MSTLVASLSHPFQGLTGLFAVIDTYLDSLRDAQRFAYLYDLTDTELAARGYTREGLIEEFFGRD